MFSLKAIFTAALVLLGVSKAQADFIRGFIEKENVGTHLLVQKDDGTQIAVRMVSTDPLVSGSISMLKAGDYLVARGTLSETTATIDAIESLGLQALVGVWTSEKLEVYEFKDFTRLNLYVPNDARSQIVMAGQFQYMIAPDQGTRYQFFMSNNGSVSVGSLQFRKSHLVLNVVDPKTGQSSADIVLSPLAKPKP